MSLNLNWYKSYDKKHKNAKNAKNEMEIFAFCVIIFEPSLNKTCYAPQNDRQSLSFVKDEHTYCKTMARKGCKKVICKGTFISMQTLINIY